MAELELEMIQVDKLPELSELEVDDLLTEAAALQAKIATEQQRLDAFVEHFMTKIERAQENFAKATEYDRAELANITDRLDCWARKHITGKKRSLTLPSGTLKLTRQQPQFLIDGEPAVNSNPVLIELARSIDAELIKSKTVETADWATLKTRLSVDAEGNVYLRDTGELVSEMTAKILPDKFEFKTA